MSVRPSARRHRHKPAKPSHSFPLTPHNQQRPVGKKIRGRLHFFGVWDDPDAALERYLRVATDLHAGREPCSPTLSEEGPTVKQLCNHFLTYQHRRSQPGEIGLRWFEDCRTVLESLARFVGPGRLVSDLAPDDFLRYQQKLVGTGLTNRNSMGVHALTRNELRVSASQRRRKNFVGLNRERGLGGLCSSGGYVRGCRRRRTRPGPMVGEALGGRNGGTMGLGGVRG